jgi:hypothetical protein
MFHKHLRMPKRCQTKRTIFYLSVLDVRHIAPSNWRSSYMHFGRWSKQMQRIYVSGGPSILHEWLERRSFGGYTEDLVIFQFYEKQEKKLFHLTPFHTQRNTVALLVQGRTARPCPIPKPGLVTGDATAKETCESFCPALAEQYSLAL